MQQLLDLLAAAADPTRLRILLLLRDVELSMGELADVLDQSQPRVSRHVRILGEAGLVRRSKEGAWVFVGLGQGFTAAEFYALADRLLDGRDPCAPERARLAQVRDARQRALDQWFEAHAADWDLMTALEGKAAGVENAIAAAARRGGVGRLLDIGTGTGRMLELLAPEAVSATGIDRSPEMLRLARAKLGGLDVGHLDVKAGDMRSLPLPDRSFDTVVLHQVLHFSDDPAAAVAEAARLVAPGGKLLLADYAPHGREELRDRFRHVRLGFESADVLRWLEAGGLLAGELSRHPGPELTTILWEGRR